MLIDNISCPALQRDIDFGYCQELQMACDDEITWEGMEDGKFFGEQIKKCRACQNRVDPEPV